MKRLLLAIAVPFIICIFGSFPALAEKNSVEMNEENSKGSSFLKGQWMLGFEAMYKTIPYRDVDDKIRPFPFISYRGDRLFFQGLELGIKLIKWENFEVAAIGTYRFGGYEADDSAFLEGMDDREGTLEAGLNVKLKTDFGNLSAKWLFDVLGKHEGHEIKIFYMKKFRVKRLLIRPYVGLSRHSSKKADYYYGVEPTEARSWRPAYDVDYAINWEAGVKVGYEISRHFMFMLHGGFEFFDNDIIDSPIVDEDKQYSVFAGVVYRF